MDEEDIPLITNRHYNMANEKLKPVYRAKTDPPNEYPEVGTVEANNAVTLLANAYAEIEHLEKKLEAANEQLDYFYNQIIKV